MESQDSRLERISRITWSSCLWQKHSQDKLIQHPVRQIYVQHWGMQHFPGIFQGWPVLTVKSAFYGAFRVAVVDFCTSKVLLPTEPGCFLLPSPPAEAPCAFLHSSSFKHEEQGEERREDKYTAGLSCHHKYLYCEKYHKIIPTVLEKTVLAL